MWRALVAAGCIAIALAGAARAQTAPATGIDTHVVEAKELFLANRLTEALQALDEQTLVRTAEANLLAGLIHLYRPPGGGEAAKLHFERAGALGIAHAYTMLGNMALDEGCADCAARALSHFERALGSGHDAEASFGLALALYRTGREEAAQKQLTDLLSAARQTQIRVLAASMLGAMLLKQEPDTAEDLLLLAAAEGEPTAQAGLGFIRLRQGRADEAEHWLARALALRSRLARSWYDSQPSERQFRLLAESAVYLKRLREQPPPYLSDAISWCRRLSAVDSFCLSHASEQHQVCTITLGTATALQIDDFPASDVYHACRLRERFDPS